MVGRGVGGDGGVQGWVGPGSRDVRGQGVVGRGVGG